MNRTILLVLYLGLGFPSAAQAVDFTVNATRDDVDALPGDGVCMTLVGDCTLRAAVQESNALAGSDRIFVPQGAFALRLAGANEDAAATGDLDLFDSVAILGSGAVRTTIDGRRQDRVFDIHGFAIISGVAIQNGQADFGGGVLVGPFMSLQLSNSVVWFNTALNSGGGIHDLGSLTIGASLIASNRSGALGGGLTGGGRNFSTIADSMIVDNDAAFGGGIGFSGLAAIAVVRSNVAHNRATASGGGIYSRRLLVDSSAVYRNQAGDCGGGITQIFNNFELFVDNSTVSGNRSNGDGGGICALGQTYVTNSTIAYNAADANGDGAGDGGGFYYNPPPLLPNIAGLSATLLARNTDAGGEAIDCGGTFAIPSGGYNLIEDPMGCSITGNLTGNIVGVAAQIRPLAANGGATPTHALRSSSPAINAAIDCFGQPVDQRGVARPQGAACDIGAFELLAAALSDSE